MPIPRSLLSRQAPTDHDLTVIRGHWPDELTGEQFGWHLGRNYVRLVPGERAAHIFSVVLP